MNHSPEIERSVLGAILLDSRLAHEAATGLSVEDFYLDAHRKIFTAVLELVANGHPVELLALGEQLKRQGSLESVGGFSYLTSLSSDSIKRDSLAHYTRTLKEKSGLRYLANLSEQIHGWTEDQEGNTESIVGRIHQAIDALQGDAVRGQIRSAKEFMGATLRELETQAKCEGLIGLPTGIVGLDDATTGVRQGELWVVGALPGRGKTAFGVQVGAANAEKGVPTLVFSLEMTGTQIGRRILANLSTAGANKIRNPKYLNASEWGNVSQNAGEVMEWPLWVDDASELSTRQLAARARLYIRKYGVKLIILDYLMLVEAPEEKETRLKAKRVANTMRKIAKEYGVSVILLSQLSRPRDKNINARPTMLDLRESGDIEAAAHVVLLLYLPLNEQGEPTGEDEIIIGKNREGFLGSLPVLYRGDRLRFYDRT